MSRVHKFLQAELDMLEIAERIAEDAGRPAAHRFFDELEEKLALYATQPEAGRARPELSEDLQSDLRSFPFGRYIIFYRLTDNGIAVVRVLHGSRDIPSLF